MNRNYIAIFLVAAATLLLEITLTKVFSVIHFHYFAFLIVSTALFGYGFSGVYLAVAREPKTSDPRVRLFISAILFALSMVISYRLILLIPVSIAHLANPQQWLYLATQYLLLAIPFFFSGLTIAILLTTYADQIHRLYFADLTGAGIGCFAIVLLIPHFGGSGTILSAAILAAAAAAAFAGKSKWILLPAFLIMGCAWMMPQAEKYFPIAQRSEKRYFEESIEQGEVLYTGWSPASRIDVVTNSPHAGPGAAIIWIDGGTNQSFLRKFESTRNWQSDNVTIGYHLVTNPAVMIIGPGGGVEVAEGLRAGAKSITAVELDPLITQLVQNRFAQFIGKIYSRRNVHLYNEEGRSFIRRTSEKYDLIQQKNNSHPMAVASGALNLTETYLLTKEAFEEYLDHLTPDGVLLIKRHGGLRLLNLAVEVLRSRGVSDYSDRLVLLQDNDVNQIFLLKNGAFTPAQLQDIDAFAFARRLRILYSPGIRDSSDSVYTRLMNEDKRRQVLSEAPFNLEAPSDDKPFMEHFFRPVTLFSTDLQQKLRDPFWLKANLSGFTSGPSMYSDLSLYVMLIESILLATVFLLYPLFRRKRSGLSSRGAGRLLGYFFGLGIGFIFVELVLIQKYILFIGYPVYSVATIIFSLLTAAGAGSFFSGRFRENPFPALRIVVMAIVAFCLFQIFVVPGLFHQFLAAPFVARILLSIALILPVGFALGMAFPLGLSFTSRHYPQFVAWAWGINGYATVFGSVLSIILGLHFGFRVVLLLAAGIYILSYFSLSSCSTS